MTAPAYRVQVTYRGAPIVAKVTAMPLLGHDKWAIGYVTPTGRHRKLNVKGNEHVADTEAACIDRLRQIAAYRGWKEWTA